MATCIAATNARVSISNASDVGSKAGTNVSKAIGKFSDQQHTDLTPIAKRMCSWAAPEYGAVGEGWDRKAMLAAQIAIYASIIGLNTFIQNKNHDIASSYADISKDKWNRFKDAYAALEKKMIAEAQNTPEPTVDYGDARNRASNAINFAYNSTQSSMARYAKLYALCMDDSLDLSYSKTLLLNDTVTYNYRDSENFRDYKSDKRWNRRSDILNLGRNTQATAFSYAQHASESFAGLAGAIAQAGNGLSGLLGYMLNRNETVYPAQFSQASLFGNGFTVAGGFNQTTVGF